MFFRLPDDSKLMTVEWPDRGGEPHVFLIQKGRPQAKKKLEIKKYVRYRSGGFKIKFDDTSPYRRVRYDAISLENSYLKVKNTSKNTQKFSLEKCDQQAIMQFKQAAVNTDVLNAKDIAAVLDINPQGITEIRMDGYGMGIFFRNEDIAKFFSCERVLKEKKITALQELKDAVTADDEVKTLAVLIAQARQKHPCLDQGKYRHLTKDLLNEFVPRNLKRY